MRLFIAVNFNDETKNRLLSIQKKIKEQVIKGNFSRPENLHLTLIFLGETPPEQVKSIRSVIEKAGLSCPPFALDFCRTGFFKHGNKELWWIGAENSDPGLRQMEKLHQNLCGGLNEAGINFDKRPYNPHITLGREIKRNQDIVLPDEKISIPVNRISLMQSERKNGLLVYTETGYSLCTGS